MASIENLNDLLITLDDNVAMIEIQRPPHNFFDVDLIRTLADALTSLGNQSGCRSVCLVSDGKSFCAGANLNFQNHPATSKVEESASTTPNRSQHIYAEAVRIFESEIPMVAAIQGPAIGGGLGLALSADFRIACPEARFAANFAKLGFHHGFGLTVTLPNLIGQQAAMDMLFTGRRVKGEEAFALGLCDQLVSKSELRSTAMEKARQIATSAPLAVRSIRKTMRADLANRVRLATDHEMVEQEWLRQTNDFREGVQASTDRREPKFNGN